MALASLASSPAAVRGADLIAAIRQATGVASGPVPLHAPEFSGAEWAYVKECLDTGWVSTAGSMISRFEEALAKRCGVAHAIATVNGTAALHAALMAAGVGEGDEVLMPALSFVATANAAAYLGAVPHFADVEESTLGLCPAALEAYLGEIAEPAPGGCRNKETGRRIAALVPMHTFGTPVDMAPLMAVASRWGLPVVEDAAEALGSHYRGEPCGSFGLLAALSFNGNKIATAGGGGAVLTNDAVLAQRVRHLTTTAKRPHAWAFEHDAVGYNYRMPNLNAALALAQVEALSETMAAKRRLHERYMDRFEALRGLSLFKPPSSGPGNRWMIVALLDEPDRALLETLLDETNAADVMTRPAWTPLNRLPMYRSCPSAPLPVTGFLADRILCLPSGAGLGRTA